MTEPAEIASSAEEVVPGVWHWSIANSNIGGATSSSHMIETPDGAVMVDPVRLADGELERLPRPAAIILTSKGHQRAAWRYRRELGVPVWAPKDIPAPDEEPDHRYEDGDEIFGGIRAVLTPGPAAVHYGLLRPGDPGVLILADLAAGNEDGLNFGPLQYHDDPETTKRSVEGLLDLPFDVLLLAHGRPLTDGKAAIRDLLAEDR
jgi:glyoxylase-like metal-dependent hydrolase (beta-lactamase superfamily II)